MRRGLVIGRFMPLHKGHVALVHFAAAQCDELIVSMTHKPDDRIPGFLRFEWLEKEFQSLQNVKLEISPDDFDDESIPLIDRIPGWSAFLKRRFPPFHIIFSSEEYGVQLAKELGISHISFDPSRKKFPVSSSLIFDQPFQYWDFIAAPARSYFVKKICLYGPESTGKSTMAKRLADIYHTEFVPEVSREIVTSNDFTVEDIIRIGEAQTERVIEKCANANKLLFCDTDLITTQIYCRHYLMEVPRVLLELERKVTYDLYFLFDVDVPWIADGLRDLGEKRSEMFNVFREELEKRKIKYELLMGNYSERESQLIKRIDQYFN